MKKLLIISFFICSSISFAQKVTLKVLDYSTKEPVEKAHVFFINKVIYTNKKGEFSVNLKKKDSINFSVSHLKYYTKQLVYNKESSSSIIYLEEKLEMLAGININTKKKLQNEIQFKKLQDLPKAVYSFGSVIKDNKIYVFGGDSSSEVEKNKECLTIYFSTFKELLQCLSKPKPISFNTYKGHLQIYNLYTKSWENIEEKLIKRAYHKAINYKDEVYLIGGKKLSKKKANELLETDIEVVSLKDLSIQKDKTNPHQAVDFGSAIYNDKILVFGGSIKKFKNGKIQFSDDIHFYDIETGYWYLLTKMPQAKEVTGIVFDDKLYLFGGYNRKNLTEIESFNLKTGVWKNEGSLFKGMKKPAITKDAEFIYLQEDGKVLTFDPKNNTLKEYKVDINFKGSEMHFYNEILYVVGGYQVEDNRKFPSNGFYSIEVNEFLNTKPTRTKRLNTTN